MAADEALAGRVREALDARRDVTEKRMFGGVCFLIKRNMLCCAGRGRMLFRVGKALHAEALRRPGARPLEMNGRRMAGFVSVDPTGYADAGLKRWLDFAAGYVGTLPAKPPKTNRVRPRSPRRAEKPAV